MSDRKINYVFIFITVALFVLEASVAERYSLMLAFLIVFPLAFTAFLLNMLTIDGTRSAILVGTIGYGFGGYEAATLLVTFFVTSNYIGLITRSDRPDAEKRRIHERRSGQQVWANAFWFVLFICVWFSAKSEVILVAAFAALSTANADTWATEVGLRLRKGKTWLITTWKTVERGTDGGISTGGTLAALSGALLIGGVSFLFTKDHAIASVTAITAGGFLGSLTDSLLGALFQHEKRKLPVWLTFDSRNTNNSVNMLATGFGAVYGIIIYNLIIYVLV